MKKDVRKNSGISKSNENERNKKGHFKVKEKKEK